MMIYTRDAWPKDGATLREAMERTAKPQLLKHRQSIFVALEQPWQMADDLRDQVESFRAQDDERPQADAAAHAPDNRLTVKEALHRILAGVEERMSQALHTQLCDGGLVSIGQWDSVGNKPKPVLPLAWRNIQIGDLDHSRCIEVETKRSLLNVRVFPVLRSPMAVEFLRGLTLSEAFEQYVANDAEFLALAGVDGVDREAALGRFDGSEPPPFDRPGCLWDMAGRKPLGSLLINPAAHVAADRVSQLFDLPIDGKITMKGWSTDGQRISLSPEQLRSPRCCCDFETSDFLQLSDTGELEVFASGLSFDEASPSREEIATASEATTGAVVATDGFEGLPQPLEDELYKRWVERVYASIPNAHEMLSRRGEKAKFARRLEKFAKVSGRTWKRDSLGDELSSLHAEDKKKREILAGAQRKSFKVVKK